jgi:hypothetical protein
VPRDERLAEADLGDELGDGRLPPGETTDDPQAVDVGEGLVDQAQLAEVLRWEDGAGDRAADVGAGGTQRMTSAEQPTDPRWINGRLYQSRLILDAASAPCQRRPRGRT